MRVVGLLLIVLGVLVIVELGLGPPQYASNPALAVQQVRSDLGL